MTNITYRDGYKYQLRRTYIIATYTITPMAEKQVPFAVIEPNGILTIQSGYAWDGASGPAFDTKDFMRASLVHDALYQLMREGGLRHSFKPQIDQLMYDICREDGMPWIRARWCLWAVTNFGLRSTTNPKTELMAPNQRAGR